MDALILACSQAKRDPLTLPHATEPICFQLGEVLATHDDTANPKAPAVLVYDGPHWRTVRRWNPAIRVFALSGRYGLFDARVPIWRYDTLMAAEMSHDWLYYHVLFGARRTFQPFDTVWICVPGGGYTRAVNYLVDTLRAGGCATRFASVVNRLPVEKWTKPAHFARTKALSQLCREHGRGRMPEAATMDEWATLVLAGNVLA
ncbi:MAG: hypothetical protein JXD18_14940 [Anaerolineae bacterium]|nr:hypothetical protein [Anaerolineae bacterium]